MGNVKKEGPLKRSALFLGLLGFAAQAGQLPNDSTFPDLVARVSPAVVNIQTTKFLKRASTVNLAQFLAAPGQPGIEAAESSLGSGFVVASTRNAASASGDGLRDVLILTNDHVVNGADEIEIMIAGTKARFRATVAAKDPQTDIAVLRARLPRSIEPLRLGDSSRIRVGEGVFAIGNPFGLGHTVTSGILSAKDRSLGVGRADRYLQTDASINPGNSGGPLFNMTGDVIGINTLIRVDAHGIGFAIPSNVVRKMLPQLESNGRVDRVWLGLVAANDSTALQARYGLPTVAEEGVVVTHLVKNAPAHKVKMAEGDLISSVSAQGHTWAVTSVADLRDILDELSPGTDIELRLRRKERSYSARLKVEAIPDESRLPEGHDYY